MKMEWLYFYSTEHVVDSVFFFLSLSMLFLSFRHSAIAAVRTQLKAREAHKTQWRENIYYNVNRWLLTRKITFNLSLRLGLNVRSNFNKRTRPRPALSTSRRKKFNLQRWQRPLRSPTYTVRYNNTSNIPLFDKFSNEFREFGEITQPSGGNIERGKKKGGKKSTPVFSPRCGILHVNITYLVLLSGMDKEAWKICLGNSGTRCWRPA